MYRFISFTDPSVLNQMGRKSALKALKWGES